MSGLVPGPNGWMTAIDPPQPRPSDSWNAGLPHERTALSWERTGISMMVAGVLLARFAASSIDPLLGIVGVAQTALGGALWAWASWHHELLHDLTLPADSVAQLAMTRRVGGATVVFSAAALVFATVSLWL